MEQAAISRIKKKTLNIEGMHCASCVSAVEKSLNKLEGVEEASVNLATESATISYDEDKVSDGDLRQAVEDAGYSIAEEETQSQTLKIEGMHCASCVSAVQQSLEELDGVREAGVNLATESAKVTYTGDLTLQDFEKAVERAGYELLRDPEYSGESSQSKAEAKRQREQEKMDKARSRMWWAWGATIPVILWMFADMIWGYTFLGDLGYELGMIGLSSLVLFYPGWETMKSAWKSSKNLTPNMDVLIAMGTLAALGTGVVALLHQFGLAPAFYSFAGIM